MGEKGGVVEREKGKEKGREREKKGKGERKRKNLYGVMAQNSVFRLETIVSSFVSLHL